GSYYYLRFGSVHWPPPGTPEPRVVVPLIMVAILATSSLPMQLAANAARRGRLWRTRLMLVWALAIQCVYLAWAIHDYLQQLQVSRPQDNAYSSIYYTLLGADHVHVAVGILLVVWLLGKLARGLTMYRLNAVQVVAFYWHAVNVLTLIVLGVLLSATL
ncbi:MAG TPA: cytochrome c oxidase subunit 3, partial [Gaiellaceae bacterium]